LQKTTCFNQQGQPQQNNGQPTTQQPRAQSTSPQSPNSASSAASSQRHSNASHQQQQQQQQNARAGTSSNNNNLQPGPSTSSGTSSTADLNQSATAPPPQAAVDCDCCSDDEMQEISEKRQSIFDTNAGPSGEPNLNQSSSSDTSSSFEELEPLAAARSADDNWQFIETTSSNGILLVPDVAATSLNPPSSSGSGSGSGSAMHRSYVPEPLTRPEIRKVSRRRSDSSLLSIKKSSSITIDTSTFDASQSGSEVKKLKVSCKKCGKTKSNIKNEILKLSEQLKASNKSEDEINAKIKQFLEYLESRSHASELTETEDSSGGGARCLPLPTSNSHDEIEEDIFDDNEGINVYATSSQFFSADAQPGTSPATGIPKRFTSLGDIASR